MSRPAESLSVSEGFCSTLLLGAYNSHVSTRGVKEAEIDCGDILNLASSFCFPGMQDMISNSKRAQGVADVGLSVISEKRTVNSSDWFSGYRCFFFCLSGGKTVGA